MPLDVVCKVEAGVAGKSKSIDDKERQEEKEKADGAGYLP
jgi:hypothetical protein